MPEPFELTSVRLRLRPVAVRDAARLHEHWTAPGVRRFLWDDQVISRQQADALVAQSERLFAERGYGLWAIGLWDGEEVVGCGGYWTFHEPPQVELVLSLDPAWWGQGLATEACRVLLRYAFEGLGWDAVRASTDAPNAASLRLIRRLGFREVAPLGGSKPDTVFFDLSAAAARRGVLKERMV